MTARILYIENGLGLGGATRCLHAMLSAAPSRGYEPFVAIAYHDPELTRWIDRDRILDLSPFRRFGVTSHPPDDAAALLPKLGRKLAGSARNLLNTVAKDAPLTRFLQTQMNRCGIQLVHTNNGLLANRAEIHAARRADLPLIAHQRCWEWSGPLSRTLARIPRRIVAVSDAVRRDLARLGAPEHKLTRIYDGVDLQPFSDGRQDRAGARKAFGLPEQALVIGHLATHLAWKGHDLFLQAMADLCRRTDRLCGLVVGSRPAGAEPLSPSPQELAHRLRIADRIFWSEHLLDPGPAYAACDIVVHASKRPEPFGLVVIEAMAWALPVVAANAGGPAETVLHGQTGLLYPLGDAEALARALQVLVSDPPLRRRLGRAARQRVGDYFAQQPGLERLFDLYDETTAAPSASAPPPKPWH